MVGGGSARPSGHSQWMANGRLLCPYHHGKAHSTAYETTLLPHGNIRFHRRT